MENVWKSYPTQTWGFPEIGEKKAPVPPIVQVMDDPELVLKQSW